MPDKVCSNEDPQMKAKLPKYDIFAFCHVLLMLHFHAHKNKWSPNLIFIYSQELQDSDNDYKPAFTEGVIYIGVKIIYLSCYGTEIVILFCELDYFYCNEIKHFIDSLPVVFKVCS